jgi:murein DD-endopeptidase MepM/ murein hydrolase activator NlpD
MDDKTVIQTPQSPGDAKTGADNKISPPDTEHVSIRPRTIPGTAKPSKSRTQKPGSSAFVIGLAAAALLLVGVSTAILTVYMFEPALDTAVSTPQDSDSSQTATAPVETTHSAETPEDLLEASGAEMAFSDAELDAQFAEVSDADSALAEAADIALIKSAADIGVIELSGDPVVVRQVQTRTRQLVALETGDAQQAASTLGATGRVMRLTDMLDSVGAGFDVGFAGSQDNIAQLQNTAFTPETLLDPDTADEGTTVLEISPPAKPKRQEYAKTITSKSTVAAELTGFGLDPALAKSADAAFKSIYGLGDLHDKDSIAVVGAILEGGQGLVPVQVSAYRDGKWAGTIALGENDAYERGEDPWFERDIFSAQLLPEDVPGGKPQRLLDAIYAVALRNGLSPAVAGETIMMMSRAHDIEQQAQKGDSIVILYTATARDPKTGFGRVIYVRVTRSDGNLECFVFQPAGGSPFQCVSPEGAASVAEAGIIMPVNGTVVAKFGPSDETAGQQGGMNFGVDLAAPKGTPVVAAAAGEVTSAGQETGLGNVIRLSHDDGSETAYAYLQRISGEVKTGAKVSAGQTIGFVGNPPNSREARLHFELKRNGEPVDPMAEVQASTGQGGAVDVFVKRIIHIESGNNCKAKNPLSTATGLGQFINSTWMTTIAVHRPDLLKLGRSQVLALRTNCELARAMTTAFTRDNASVIRSRGHPVTPGHLYLAHFLGVGGALKVLGSPPGQQISAIFGEAHVRANPFERGKSIGFLREWAARKMGAKTPNQPYKSRSPPEKVPASEMAAQGKGPSDPQSGSEKPGKSLVQQVADPKFAEMKRNVEILLR